MTKRKTRPRIDIDLNKVEALASRGMNNEQIAYSLGIGLSTLYKEKAQNVEFLDAIKRGQAKGIQQITNALFENAKEGNLGAQVFYLKNRAGWTDKQDITTNGESIQTNLVVDFSSRD